MIYVAKESERLVFRSMGKSLRITAIATSDEEANKHMRKPGNMDGVIAVLGPFILMADVYDKGTRE